MNKMKIAWNWIKEKWWIPLSAFAALVVTLLMRPKNTSIKTVNENRQLEKDIRELELEALRKENEERLLAMARAGVKVQTLNDEKKRKELQMMEEIRKRKSELSTRSNKELAEMLKKANEV